MPTLATFSNAAAQRAFAGVRRVGNGNSSKSLEGEGTARGRSSRPPASAPHRNCTCQNGTEGGGPPWNGPHLRPSFVAQVLGQVMMDPLARASSLAPAAYRQAQIAQGRLLDRGI